MYSVISGKFTVMIVYPYQREFRVTEQLSVKKSRPKFVRFLMNLEFTEIGQSI